MPLNNQALTNKTDLYSVLIALKDLINYNMNCVKIATVISFDKETLTAKCRVNNKRLRQLKNDGNQILENYPDIYAKVHFFGWGDIGSVYPIEEGMEGLLLFNDRELETWYLTGDGGNLAYDRCHDLTDAIFICGLHSKPNIPLLPYIEACLHIYYKNSDFQLKEDYIESNTKNFIIKSESTYSLETTTQTEKANTRNITATTNHTGTITATQLNDTSAATGNIVDSNGKVLANVVNGIVRTIY